MTPEVAEAIDEIKRAFPNADVTATEVGDGGAHVSIERVDLGPHYLQRDTWVRFTIGFQYPNADVYPLFVRPDLNRSDGKPHGEGISISSFNGEAALQLSRRSNRLDPTIDTAALKVRKVIAWMESR